MEFEELIDTGQKVRFIPDGTIYDFAYWGMTGKAVVYTEGERNGQDAFAIDPSNLEIVNAP